MSARGRGKPLNVFPLFIPLSLFPLFIFCLQETICSIEGEGVCVYICMSAYMHVCLCVYVCVCVCEEERMKVGGKD
jgi:hypothetical protein